MIIWNNQGVGLHYLHLAYKIFVACSHDNISSIQQLWSVDEAIASAWRLSATLDWRTKRIDSVGGKVSTLSVLSFVCYG